ncbi:GPI anchored cell wall protein [Hirsutella rhossiliensis]|uniref:GPI anchored cell wall protein n=1 Tax=Hirsutella rhossiliensis TaxID=111463 RepID=A0A9P8MMA2_9HYPO|nr:GPI anchored cell wall protein [Hirsutella rhossiliensis]KAH0957938.1 GPI anchored cell wall protein [Hirsutella rhossiliensis]
MIPLLLSLGTHVVANALAVGKSGCPLHLTVGGAVSGPVGQIASGQARAGTGIEAATFELRGSHLVDSHGRGCWWTPPTGILQCDDGQKPDNGFTIGCDGTVHYNNQTAFHECGTADRDQHNIYLEPKGVNCAPAALKADSCAQANCSSSPPMTKPAPTPPKTCPADLGGPFEFPHLIVPVDRAQPDRVAGTSYFGEASSTVSSIFNFDIPSGDRGKSCSLVFLFPQQSHLDTSSSTVAGTGQLQFTALRSAASKNSTYNTKPAEDRSLLNVTAVPGNNYTVDSFDCPAGQQVTIEMSAAEHTSLRYFQDSNSSPIGLYITKC